MSRNNTYINNQREFYKQLELQTPVIYASIAIALHEGNMPYELIADIFARSQEIWAENNGNLISMLIKCYNETGIQLMTQKQYDNAVKKGLIKEG